MKRHEALKKLQRLGCEISHEGTRHTIMVNPKTGEWSAIPRHTEIKNSLLRKICKDLGIPPIV